jgi:cell division protein FtsI (penicillin-binding protein 3)
MGKRAIILNTLIAFTFIVVIMRLADIMLFNHQRFLERAKRQQISVEDIQVRRGIIFDRKGREMAVNLEVESLYGDPAEMVSPEGAASLISRQTGKPEKAIYRKLRSEGRFVWIERKLEPETTKKIKALGLKGIGFIQEAKRFYPKGLLASHIIGTVNIDNKGIEGIELQYDRFIRSNGGKVFFKKDASGRRLSEGVDMEHRGNNIVLTIDEGLQAIVEAELDDAISRWKASAATAIIMDPWTGEVLALANRPTYNPNSPSRKESDRRNRAITDVYEPGSTFKIIVGTAALEEKIVRLDTLFDCSNGFIEIGGKKIRDAHKHGILTFKEVIQKSSNVGSSMIGLRLGKERIYRYAKSFGFGEKTGIDLPGEVAGWIRPPERWSGTSIGAISIGQEVAVTPLQVLRAYSAIANGGLLVTPHVVSKIFSPDGKMVWSYTPSFKRAISEETASIFKEILKTVTEEGGTATAASVEGNDVAGKTGTAQVIDPITKRYSKDRYIASFVGFVPADKPRLSIIVVIYEPKGIHYGGVVAAPVFKKIAENALSYLNVPREDMNENILVVKNSGNISLDVPGVSR